MVVKEKKKVVTCSQIAITVWSQWSYSVSGSHIDEHSGVGGLVKKGRSHGWLHLYDRAFNYKWWGSECKIK